MLIHCVSMKCSWGRWMHLSLVKKKVSKAAAKFLDRVYRLLNSKELVSVLGALDKAYHETVKNLSQSRLRSSSLLCIAQLMMLSMQPTRKKNFLCHTLKVSFNCWRLSHHCLAEELWRGSSSNWQEHFLRSLASL